LEVFDELTERFYPVFDSLPIALVLLDLLVGSLVARLYRGMKSYYFDFEYINRW
jgi:hypothetical protein